MTSFDGRSFLRRGAQLGGATAMGRGPSDSGMTCAITARWERSAP